MIRQYRDPRDGEVMAFVSRHAGWARVYGDEIRFRPSPCCQHNKHDNPSATVNAKNGLWRCFACGAAGNYYQLTKEFGHPIAAHDRYKSNDLPEIQIDWVRFFDLKKRRLVSGGHYPELLSYLHARGFSNEILDKWRITSMGPNSIRVPIYQWDGKWRMVNARIRVCLHRETTNHKDWFEIRGGPTGLLMGNPTINFNGPKRALIFEGQWDAMTATAMGIDNAFSLPNGCQNINVAQMLRYIPDDWDIWVCTDMDSQGEDAAEKFFAQLGHERVYRLRVKAPYKDLNEWYLAEPTLGIADLESALVGFSGYHRADKPDQQHQLQPQPDKPETEFLTLQFDELAGDDKTIVATTPWPKVNKILGGGFWGGQTTGLLAPSGRGKTTWCNQLALHVASLGSKVGLISLEGTRLALQRKIREMVVGGYAEEDYSHIQSNLIISNLEGSRVTPAQCVHEFIRMIEVGTQLLVMDNLDFICRDDNALKVSSYAALIEIATKNNVHIVVVWQPNKVDRNTTVNSGNQKGYSQTFQDSDNYINLNTCDGYNILELEKNRELGVFDDNRVTLKYDLISKGFVEQPDCEVDQVSKTEFSGRVINLKRGS